MFGMYYYIGESTNEISRLLMIFMGAVSLHTYDNRGLLHTPADFHIAPLQLVILNSDNIPLLKLW